MRYGHFSTLPTGAFEPVLGRMRLFGSNPISDIVNTVSDAVSSVGQDIGNLGSSISDAASSVGSWVDNNVPGGWAGVGGAALLAAGIADPTLLGLADSGSLSADAITQAGLDPNAVATSIQNVAPNIADISAPAVTTDAANTQALADAFANPTLPSSAGTQLADAGTVVSDAAPTTTDSALSSLGNAQPNYLTAGQNLGGSTLGEGQLYTPLSALNDGTLGAGLVGSGAGLGLATTADTAAAAGLGGATAADIGAQSLGQLGLAGSGATLGAASAGALNGLGGGGSVLSSLLPSTALGQAALLSGVSGVASGLIGANASQNAANTQAQAAQNAAAIQQQMFNTQNAQLAPNRAAGYNALNQLQGNLAGPYTQYDANGNPIGTAQGSGYFTNQMTAADLANNLSPGYQFGLNQGLGQASNIANATGGRLGGNTLQGLNQYAQNYAQTGAQQAFTNYQTQRTNIYNTLAGIAGIGQQAQGTTANLASNVAQQLSNLGVGSAAAQAAGQIGQAGAYTGGLNNIANNLTLAALLNPSASSNYVAPVGGYASTLGSLNIA
jgi:hypothetical protein